MNEVANEIEEELYVEVEPEAVESAETETEINIRNSVVLGVEADQDEDGIKLAMIKAGATFKNVTRLYNEILVEIGLAVTRTQRDEIIDDELEGLDLDEATSFGQAVVRLMERLPGATSRSASSLIRFYCKKHDMPCYLKPKTDGGVRLRFVNRFYDFLADDPKMLESRARAFIMGENGHPETSDNVKTHLQNYLDIFQLVSQVAHSD